MSVRPPERLYPAWDLSPDQAGNYLPMLCPLSQATGDMKRKCAYCASNGPLTKEHIIPAFLSKRFPDINTGIPPKSKHVAKFEGTMRDVCANCNSGPLSDLDAYAQSFIGWP